MFESRCFRLVQYILQNTKKMCRIANYWRLWETEFLSQTIEKSGLVELFLNIGAWSYKGDKVFGFWFNCKITDTDIRDAISLNKQIWWH